MKNDREQQERVRQQEQQIIYAFARTEEWLSQRARDYRQPESEFITRVAELLLAQRAGTPDRMPALPGARTGAGSPVGALALDERSYSAARGENGKGKRRISEAGMRAIRQGQRKRWTAEKRAQRAKQQAREARAKQARARAGRKSGGRSWDGMSKAERSAEMMRRRKVAAENRAAIAKAAKLKLVHTAA